MKIKKIGIAKSIHVVSAVFMLSMLDVYEEQTYYIHLESLENRL